MQNAYIKIKSKIYLYRHELILTFPSGVLLSLFLKESITPILFFGKEYESRNPFFQISLVIIYIFLFSILSFGLFLLLERIFLYSSNHKNYLINSKFLSKLRRINVSVVSICFLILVPLIAHLLFSPLGFNPTDDGFTLSYSRRIIEGQIPHKDFIIIRPILSPLLHVPFVLLGGNYTLLFSRLFVWFQMACISWVWISFLEKRFTQNPFPNLVKVSFALITFAISVHTFPIMAWHTLDGLFMISIGLALYMTKIPVNKFAGYIFIGLSYMCKQSFIFVAPMALFLLGDWRKKSLWAASLLPGILYVLFLLVTNALPDAILQLVSQGNSFFTQSSNIFNDKMYIYIIVGCLSSHLFVGNAKNNCFINKDLKEWFGLLMLSLIPIIYLSKSLLSTQESLLSSFYIFGLVLGVVIDMFIGKIDKINSRARIGLFILVVAWSVSLSLGYKYPVLASGQLLAFLLAFTYPFFQKKLENNNPRPIYTVTIICLSIIVLISFGEARFRSIYRDQAASNLTKDLEGVLLGGSGIRTNENTYEFLRDLKETIKISKRYGETYTIIPDCAINWVKSKEVNPISIDWPLRDELNNTELENRVFKELNSKRKTNIVIVQKFETYTLEWGFYPIQRGYPIVNYVRDNYSKVFETTLFELYQ